MRGVEGKGDYSDTGKKKKTQSETGRKKTKQRDTRTPNEVTQVRQPTSITCVE